jgi:hypothetical protein
MLSHESLANYYKTNFAMMQHHNYSLAELEDQLPFEREIYIAMLLQHLDKEKRRHEEAKAKNSMR